MPESTRTEIVTARESLARATTLAGWGLLYLVIGALWWPGLLIAVAIVGTAWRRARTAADVYALLIEAAARLHTADLARSLGIDHTGPLNQQTGSALTCLLQGKSYLIPSPLAGRPPREWRYVPWLASPLTGAPGGRDLSAADSDVDGMEPSPEWAGDAIAAKRFGSPEAIRAALLAEQVGEFDAAFDAANPDGGVYQLVFGGGRGLITYLLLTDQDRVDVLIVTWVDFG